MADFDAALTFRVETNKAFRDIKAGKEKAKKNIEKPITVPVDIEHTGLRELREEFKQTKDVIVDVSESIDEAKAKLAGFAATETEVIRRLNRLMPGAGKRIQQAFETGGEAKASKSAANIIKTVSTEGFGKNPLIEKTQKQATRALDRLINVVSAQKEKEDLLASELTDEQKRVGALVTKIKETVKRTITWRTGVYRRRYWCRI